MARRRAREFVLKALYQADVSVCSVQSALEGLFLGLLEQSSEEKPAEADEQHFALAIAKGIDGRREEIDGYIEQASKNWRLTRMPVVDRSILRMATGEMLLMKEIPASVTINEAVELAKRYGEKESRAFVNGILDRIASILGRGGRQHSQA